MAAPGCERIELRAERTADLSNDNKLKCARVKFKIMAPSLAKWNQVLVASLVAAYLHAMALG